MTDNKETKQARCEAVYAALNDRAKRFVSREAVDEVLSALQILGSQAPAVEAGARDEHELPQSVLDALRFYAHGHHYNIDSDHQQFDTVSGEPQNWLFSERDDDCTMIEDGSIARAALCGGAQGFEEPTTPVEGEIFRAAIARVSEAAQPVSPSVAQDERAAWSDHPAALDAKALATAHEISLMWGRDRSQFVSRIQVAVRGAMDWAARAASTPANVAQGGVAPDAYVPIHPKNGALWANTVPTLDCDHPSHYEMRPVYFAAPTPVADGGAAFEWPALPDLPLGAARIGGVLVFTEHHMQGYANAYGEIVRATLAAAKPVSVDAGIQGASK